MDQLTISQVAREIRLRPSAIRYYERIGLLPPAQRLGGQRRYDRTVLSAIPLALQNVGDRFLKESLRSWIS